jgi:TetR/AcrR family transcriptional repressor of nem operon
VLPDSIQEKTRRYFDLHLDWLTGVIEAGRTAGELHWPGEARALAVLLLTTLEGGSLVARAQQAPELVLAGFAQVMMQIRTPA